MKSINVEARSVNFMLAFQWALLIGPKVNFQPDPTTNGLKVNFIGPKVNFI
jgi:hypothetical protein